MKKEFKLMDYYETVVAILESNHAFISRLGYKTATGIPTLCKISACSSRISKNSRKNSLLGIHFDKIR